MLHLKKLLTILLALAFVVQSTSQLWIKAAFYSNRDYIANNLCINRFDAIPVCKGSCYLEEKLSQDKEQQKSTSAEVKVKEIVLFFQQSFVELYAQNDIASFIEREFNLFSNNCIPQNFISKIFHPPATLV